MKKLITMALLCAAVQGAQAQDESGAMRFRMPFGDRRVIEVSLKDIMQAALQEQATSTEGMTDEEYDAIEQELFRRMNWGQEEIDWFRNVYTPLYGDPEGYVLGQMELLDVLDQEP